MKIEIRYFTKSDVNVDYIDSLNSVNHIGFSPNIYRTHDIEKQLRYIDEFDFSSSFILAIHDRSLNCLVGTSTFYVDDTSRVINVSLLIFEKYSEQDYGTIAMKEIVKFIELFFPFHTLEVGADYNDYPMINIVKSIGFSFDYENNNTFFYRKKNVFTRILKTLSENEIIVICNDAGGAANIASLLKILDIQPEGLVTGPAILVFKRLKVKFHKINFYADNFADKLVILGSSIYGGEESLALEDPRFERCVKTVILDHWMNYQERFHKNGKVLPDQFWVTNSLAYELASQTFHEIPIELIPDSQLALIRRSFYNLHVSKDSLLLIWEYQTISEESLKFPVGSLRSRITQIGEFCSKQSIKKVIVRLHPSQGMEDFESNNNLLQNNIQVEISTNRRLETDLASAVLVVGFSSAALYFASELDIPTYSFYKGIGDHWTNFFPKIEKFDN